MDKEISKRIKSLKEDIVKIKTNNKVLADSAHLYKKTVQLEMPTSRNTGNTAITRRWKVNLMRNKGQQENLFSATPNSSFSDFVFENTHIPQPLGVSCSPDLNDSSVFYITGNLNPQTKIISQPSVSFYSNEDFEIANFERIV